MIAYHSLVPGSQTGTSLISYPPGPFLGSGSTGPGLFVYVSPSTIETSHKQHQIPCSLEPPAFHLVHFLRCLFIVSTPHPCILPPFWTSFTIMSSLALPTAAKKPASLALPGSTPQPATQSAMPATQQRPIASAGNTSRLAADHSRGSASPSPEPEDDADGEGDDDDEEHKKPKSSKKKKSTASAALGVDGAGRQEYRYTNEISQMVSGEGGG